MENKIKEEVLKKLEYMDSNTNNWTEPEMQKVIREEAIDLTLEKVQQEYKNKVKELKKDIDNEIKAIDNSSKKCIDFSSFRKLMEQIKNRLDEIFGDEK